ARHEVMNVGDPAGHRVLDRDHGKFCLAVRHGVDSVLKGRAWHRLKGPIRRIQTGNVGIRPKFALEDDLWSLGRYDYVVHVAVAPLPHWLDSLISTHLLQRTDVPFAGKWRLVKSMPAQRGASHFEIIRGVDAERDRGHDGDVDPHAGLKRAQLLELFAPLQ